MNVPPARYHVSVNPSEDLCEVVDRLKQIGFKTLRRGHGGNSLDIEGPQSAKTQLSRVPGIEHVVYIRVQRGD